MHIVCETAELCGLGFLERGQVTYLKLHILTVKCNRLNRFTPRLVGGGPLEEVHMGSLCVRVRLVGAPTPHTYLEILATAMKTIRSIG